ncbi:SulP family sulfate permease [Agromyces terreus]|uniref:SulP family sulfate permease n=1 Tax=Agromyces terreus TaxID=424795 RepID=A0A9X2KAZ5_9MICO|nr:SulP family inorganic anion transporter [Agromyces terreus]MCP2369595.1 SulP family sulfate permease [Agromyces terreus]
MPTDETGTPRGGWAGNLWAGLRGSAADGLRSMRGLFDRRTLKSDVSSGLVLGLESVPDGLASGLLAGVNPLAGLYGYMFGMVGAAFATGSAFMAVQATGAMALVVSDSGLETRPDPDRALYTLAILTGVFMIIAGVLRAGRLLRFVPTAVMTGFITAVGVNIILGQLSNFTGYEAEGSNRVIRTFDLITHFWRVDLPTTVVGLVTVVLIVWLQRTRLRSLGLVVAIVLGSALAAAFDAWFDAPVMTIQQMVDVPRGLPGAVLPVIDDMIFLLVPALSLSFVGLVQGAAVSTAFPNPDGRPVPPSRDFIGQGAGNLVAGLFQGMPVGGSMSASALAVAGGAKTRLAMFIAGLVMAVTLLLLSGVVGYVAMPALAALLIVVGFGTIKPAQVYSVARSGAFPLTIMAVTFTLTLVIPLQFAVLVGVALGIVLFVADQSNSVRVRQLELIDDGRMREVAPAERIGPKRVVVLQPYGSLFFASAPRFESQLPTIDERTRRAVVVMRLRGIDQLGFAAIEVLKRYGRDLDEHGSRLVLVVSNDRVMTQLELAGLAGELGDGGIVRGNEWIGAGVRDAVHDARTWVRADPDRG